MRNPNEDRKEAVLESLRMCGLTGDQMTLAEEYMNGESDQCDLGISNTIAFLAQGNLERNDMINKCLERLNRHGEDESIRRYFDLLFQIFGLETRELYAKNLWINKMLDADKLVAIRVTQLLETRWSYGHADLWGSILSITTDRCVMKKALSYTNKEDQYLPAEFCILSAMFYDKTSEEWDQKPIFEGSGEKEGIFQKLAGGLLGAQKDTDHFKRNSYADEYPEEFAYYEKLAVELVPRIFDSQFSEPQTEAMRLYVAEGDIKKPAPDNLRTLLSGSVLNEHMATALLGSAILNYRLSPVIYRFVRLCMDTIYREKILDRFLNAYKTDMTQEILRWKADFVLDDIFFINWLAGEHRGVFMNSDMRMTVKKVLCEMTKIAPDAYLDAMKQAGTEMVERLKEAAELHKYSDFYRKNMIPMMAEKKADFQKNVIEEIVETRDINAKNMAVGYLSGQCEISALYGQEALLAPEYKWVNVSSPLQSYITIYEQDAFYERCVTYIGLSSLGNSVFSLCREGLRGSFQADCMTALFDILKRNGLDLAHRLSVGTAIYDDYMGNQNDKRRVLEKVFTQDMEENREETLNALLSGAVIARSIGLSILSKNPEQNKAEILRFLSDTSKQIKEELVDILAHNEAWTPELIEVLKTSKKSGEREVVAMALAKCSDILSFREELISVVQKEKSKKVIDQVNAILRKGNSDSKGAEDNGTEKDASGVRILSADEYVKECHRGGKKRSLAWLYEEPMPPVHFAGKNDSVTEDAISAQETKKDTVLDKETQSTANEEFMQAILISYASMPHPGVNPDVRILSESLDQDELNAFMEELFRRFLAAGAESKKKWVLYAASIHGGSRIVSLLKRQIDEWAANSRGAIAAEAVKALALNNSPTALILVDGMSRKYKVRQVRWAAQEAMAFAADQLGLTVEELADRIVPDLGFDEKLERRFDYGTRSFTVKISPNLDIEVKDQTGKKIKTLPAVGKNDDEAKATAALEAFKEFKKQMKTVVKTQAQRLDFAMSLNRRWTVENWKKLFVKNPIMHQFAISLIWGHYVNEELVGVFRYMEDGTFNTVDEEEYELSDEGQGLIGLVHPVELATETINAWKEQLSDYEIKQSVEQLDRPVFKLMEEEKGKKRLERFGGKMLNGLSIAGKLTELGWIKGTPEDAGVYYLFYRVDSDAGYAVDLYFSGSYIGDENDEVTVYDAAFYPFESYFQHSYSCAEEERDKTALRLDEIPVRYFSEIVYQLTKATASSTETDANWRKNRI